MALPEGVETVVVRAELRLPGGAPARGRLLFSGPDLVTIGAADVVVVGSTSVVLVDGAAEVTLLATDAVGMDPTGWTYRVQAQLTNGPSWTRYVLLPAAVPEVDLADVLLPDPALPEYVVLQPVPPAVPPPVVGAYKTVPQDVVSSTVLVDDAELVVELAAGTAYAIDTYLDCTADPAADLLLTIVAPAGATGTWTPNSVSLGNTNNIGSVNRNVVALGASAGVGILTDGSGGTIATPTATVHTGETGGELRLRWAQNAPSATPTVVRAGSWLRAVRLSQ